MMFGNQAQPPKFGTFSFGATTGTTSTSSFSSPFSNPSTNVSGTGFSFGNTTTTTTVPPNLFGAPTGLMNPSTSTTLFPTPSTSIAPVSSGFNFGAGQFGSNNTGFNFGSSTVTVTTTMAPSIVGLGGVDLQASSIAGARNTSAKKDKAVKETFIPHELVTTVESYKKFIKEQKAIREEMSRVSSKNIDRVQSQVTVLRQQLSVVSNGLQRNAVSISKLKQESSEELSNAEIIQRTKDTPPALQYENTAPTGYFNNLAISFENQMQSYRQQIEQLERHLISLSHPTIMTPNELTVVMKRLHDTFVTLAAQLQTVHQQVQSQKEQFLAFKKKNEFFDVSSVFHSRKSASLNSNSTELVGPSPLLLGASAAATALSHARSRLPDGSMSLRIGDSSFSALSTSLGSSNFLSPQTGFTNSFGLSSNSTFKPLGTAGMSSFGNSGLGAFGFQADTTSLTPFGVNNQKPFQLQKPPSGNKRGKRWTST